jgi:hypothetical protein
MGWPGVAKWVSPGVSAALRSTVLGPAIEFTFSAGDVVTARCASVPGAVGLVLMAVRGALVVDGPHGLLERTASLSPCPTNRDRRGNDDGPGGRQERPQDRRGHEGQPVTQTTKQFMRQLLYSSQSRGNRVGPAGAQIIRAHHGKTGHEANGYQAPPSSQLVGGAQAPNRAEGVAVFVGGASPLNPVRGGISGNEDTLYGSFQTAHAISKSRTVCRSSAALVGVPSRTWWPDSALSQVVHSG